MSRTKWILVALAILVVAVFVWRELGSRSAAEADDAGHDSAAVVPAAIARAEKHPIASALAISGEFKPFQDVDIHAKVAGYIKTIYVDVGDHVKQGQTLAVLEIPELAAQLAGADAAVRRAQEEIRRAHGDLQRAESAHAAAHTAYTRLKQAADARAGLVAQQEVDDAQAKDLEGEAQVASAQAALSVAEQQLQVAQASQKQEAAMEAYSKITAPFSGVITTRYADTGALIAAGTNSSTQSMPVVRLAEVSKLRLVLPVPESVAAQIHLGDPVKVRVQALNRDIVGKVSRFADSLDLQTRTMATEIDFENRDGQLIPGMYAETQLSLAAKKDALTVPLDAVNRNGDDATALVVNSQDKLEERHVKLGLEDNARVEVLSGLQEGDRVVIGNRSQFRVGQKVQPKPVNSQGSNEGGQQ